MKLLHKLNGPFVIRSGKVLDKLEVGAVAMSLENVRAFRQREMPFLVFFWVAQYYHQCNRHFDCPQSLIPQLVQTMHLQHSIVQVTL